MPLRLLEQRIISDMAYVTNPTRVVSVIFTDAEDRGLPSSGREYHYLIPVYITQLIEPGDHVVVDVQSKLKLCRVVSVMPATQSTRASKPIAGTVDDKAHRREIERQAEIDRTVAALEALEQKRQRHQRFMEIAQNDPSGEAGQLFARLNQLERQAHG